MPGQPVIHLDPDLIAGLAFKKMRLFIRKVRCVQETYELLEGSDAINMGGNFTTADGKTTVLVDQFKVSDDFDEGELVDFGSSKAFASWDLVDQLGGFPLRLLRDHLAWRRRTTGASTSFSKTCGPR